MRINKTILAGLLSLTFVPGVFAGDQPLTVKPVPSRLKKFMPSRHNEKLEQAKKGDIDFVMIGDSITHNWESEGNYAATFADCKLLNLGFAGDRTENVLWRIQHGALDGISPKLVTLMIGTNNSGSGHDPADIFTGIKTIVAEVRKRLPDAKVVVLSIFPRKIGPMNDRVMAVNKMLPQLADQKHVFHVDINRGFLNKKGEQIAGLYRGDRLHLSSEGYTVWTKALMPLLEQSDLKLNLVKIMPAIKRGRKKKGRSVTSVAKEQEQIWQSASIKIACVGDSITYGHGLKNRDKESYPAQLGAMLGQKYAVRNYGVSASTLLKKGNKPYWKLPQFMAVQKDKPNIVIIKLGTNDMKPNNWKYKDEYKPNYVEMIKTFQKLESKPTVMICYPLPIFRTKGDFKDSIVREEIIPLVDQVAKEAGVKIINLYKPMAGKNELSRDGVHPNVAGTKLMAETVAKVIRDEEAQ